jgi:hypothetical protein
MDIVLGAIGAFFFLLIILSASRRGLVQEGIQLPPNMMIISVEQPKELIVGKSIHYFVAQLRDEYTSEVEKIFYSDVAIDAADKNKLIEVRDTLLAIPCILAPDNPPPIIVGIWLQDVQDVLSTAELAELPKLERIDLNIICKKIYKYPSGFNVELKRENNYFAVYQINTGKEVMDDIITSLRYNGQPLVCAGLPCRSDGEKWKPVSEEVKFEKINAQIGIVHIDNAYATEDIEKQFFYKDTGFVTLNKSIIIFRFIGGFNHQHENTNKDPRIVLDDSEKIKKLLGNRNATYLSVGYRAVCAVMEDGSLRFQILDDYQYSWSGQSYPFNQYAAKTPIKVPTNKVDTNNKIIEKEIFIGEIPKDTVNNMIGQMTKIEPALSNNYNKEQLKCMLAEIIAAPNTRKAPYPVVRQNPLLWKLQ